MTGVTDSVGPPNPRSGTVQFQSRGMGTFQVRPDSKPINTPHTSEETFEDERDPSKMARLYSQSVGYKNLASNKFVAQQAKMAVSGGLKDAGSVREHLRSKWLRLYQLYRGESLAPYSYGRAPLHSPEPFKIVETLVPKMFRHLFGTKRWFEFSGHADNDDASAEAQEMLCRDQLRTANYRKKALEGIRNGLIYGTNVQKVFWQQQVGDVMYRKSRRVPDPMHPGASKVELSEAKREELVFDGNQVENVEIFDFYAPPNASGIEDAEWCADRTSWPDWKVKQQGELGHWLNLEKLRDYAGLGGATFSDEFKARKSYTYGVFDPDQATHAEHIPHYEVVDWWGPLVIQDDRGNYTTKECNVVIIDPTGMQLVVRVTENPYWHKKKPYQSFRPISLHQEFYGIGPLEPIARLSMEKDMKRNLLMASAQLEANPMFQVSDAANLPDGQLLIQPGHVYRVPDIQKSIAPIHVPQVSDAALKAERVLTQDIREAAGTTSPSMGASDPLGKAKTATQHTSEVDEGNTRMLSMLENYETGCAVPMLEQMTFNNQQFMSYPRVVRRIGGIGIKFNDNSMIRPEDIIGKFIVEVTSSSKLATKQTMVQQLTNLLDRAPVINQMYGPQAVKMPQLLALIMEQGFDIQNTNSFISIPPEEAGLMTAFQEHEVWYHGNVPSRHPDDNDMRHWMGHMEEFKTDRYKEFSDRHPAIAARALAHAAEHAQKLMLLSDMQEKSLMDMSQLGAMQQALNQGPGAGLQPPGGSQSPSGIAGAAGPGQSPGSPQIRRNEVERGEGQEAHSEAMQQAPNPGAS